MQKNNYRLALIGKNIEHSRSPEIYKNLLNIDFTYELLDYKDDSEIPSLDEFLDKYDALNITSPYKEYFFEKLEKCEVDKSIGAVNCIKKIGDKLIGYNTDFLAIKDILENKLNFQDYKIIVMGNGVMARTTISALELLKVENFDHLTRSTDGDLQIYNFEENYSDNNLLIINTCSRSFNFQGKVKKNFVYWDYNYRHNQSEIDCHYLDGFSLLLRQAEYAAEIWSF